MQTSGRVGKGKKAMRLINIKTAFSNEEMFLIFYTE